MRGEKTLAVVADERQEGRFLFGFEWEVALGVEEHRVEVVEVLLVGPELALGERLGIGVESYVEQTRLLADLGDRVHGVGNGIVGVVDAAGPGTGGVFFSGGWAERVLESKRV